MIKEVFVCFRPSDSTDLVSSSVWWCLVDDLPLDLVHSTVTFVDDTGRFFQRMYSSSMLVVILARIGSRILLLVILSEYALCSHVCGPLCIPRELSALYSHRFPEASFDSCLIALTMLAVTTRENEFENIIFLIAL